MVAMGILDDPSDEFLEELGAYGVTRKSRRSMELGPYAAGSAGATTATTLPNGTPAPVPVDASGDEAQPAKLHGGYPAPQLPG